MCSGKIALCPTLRDWLSECHVARGESGLLIQTEASYDVSPYGGELMFYIGEPFGGPRWGYPYAAYDQDMTDDESAFLKLLEEEVKRQKPPLA